MTVQAFKSRLIALFGPKHYAKARLFYMQVFAAAYKADEMDELEGLLDFLEDSAINPDIVIRYPESYFVHFTERDDLTDDFNQMEGL